MGIDTSIYANALRPVKSVQDYDNEYMQGQQNKLALSLGQQKADEYTRTLADSNQLRNVVKGFGEDTNANQQALLSAGRLPEANAYAKSVSDQNKANLEAHKMKLETGLKQFESMAQVMSGVKDQASYDQARQQAVQIMGPEAAAQIPAIYDPAQVAQGQIRAMSIKDQMAEKWKAIDAQLAADKFTEDKSQHKVQNANQAGQLAVSQGNLGLQRQKFSYEKEQAASGDDPSMDPLAIRMTAQQYLAGDPGAINNFGRGAQGSKNLSAVRLEIAKQANAAGMTGADIAAKMAEFGGMKAGQRTAGTRSASIEIAANEAAQLAPLALDASQKVSRSGLLPFGKAQIMFDSNTNDPNLRQFAMANNALANAYGQVMSRGGVATVSDKEHAKELLSTAFDQPSYAAAVQQLQAEIKAAQKAPQEVRKAMSKEIGGGGHGASGGVIDFGSLK